MANYKFTKCALKDLSSIWDYTVDTWSEKQADIYYRLIIDTCEELANKPALGKDYSEIFPNLKGQITSKHIIFYREIDNNTIEITRILHGKMDLKNKLKK
ncbi:type II toxin-antitoxin system RelE/ParE family toxin [Membranihabitans maritimus]|uniref:type II toxin-antitoxin system RelE/ParE family toxin n=1 Tax=Membranihabitans maritimus TaxID=2904244 RepID=UPI001F41F7F6